MPKLHQLLAIEKPTKTETYAKITKADRILSKQPELLAGFTKTYRPKDEEGDQLPSESKKVVVRAEELLQDVKSSLARLFDVTLTKDVGNSTAKANIVVDDGILAVDVPVTYLLFLEKQLTDLHTMINRLPTLPEDEDWHSDGNTNLQVTSPTVTVRNKKIPFNHVKAWPTKDHPNIIPQVEVLHSDELQGYWTTVKMSGALPVKRVREMLYKVEKLQKAVLFAREQANSVEVQNKTIGEDVLTYIFD